MDIKSGVARMMTAKFAVDGELVSCEPIGSGHINGTYKVVFDGADGSAPYVIQQVNTEVFKKPVELMSNVAAVTGHIRKKNEMLGRDPFTRGLVIIPARDGRSYAWDNGGGFWRMFNYIPNSFSYDAIESPETFRLSGEAFGEFMSLLADFPGETLFETIPDFHDTLKRYKNLLLSEQRDPVGRAKLCRAELDFAKARAADTSALTSALEKGELPVRVTHNDTKLNNVLFDKDSGEALCVVDLDTVMPGSALYDFGDSIRFGANTAAEDETDLSKVSLDLGLYEQFTAGYLSKAGDSLTPAEIDRLALSAKIITFECGMRFLTDYIDGDKYFGTAYPEHNIDRARCQFALVADMEKKLDEMNEVTRACARDAGCAG